jgi:hypothetical protein
MGGELEYFKGMAAAEAKKASAPIDASAELRRSLAAAYLALASYQEVLDRWKDEPEHGC